MAQKDLVKVKVFFLSKMPLIINNIVIELYTYEVQDVKQKIARSCLRYFQARCTDCLRVSHVVAIQANERRLYSLDRIFVRAKGSALEWSHLPTYVNKQRRFTELLFYLKCLLARLVLLKLANVPVAAHKFIVVYTCKHLTIIDRS